jgi:hypothetical protein
MWYLFEPRSDNYYYDDDGSGGSKPSWDWKFILWLPVIVLLMFFIGIAPFLMMVWYFLNDVYTTLKKTVETGRLSYPFLVKVGVVVAIILSILWLGHSPNTPIHLGVYLVLAIGFVLIFTILPIFALCVHGILKIHLFLNTKLGGFKSFALYIIFLGVALATFIFYLGFSRLPSSTAARQTETPKAENISSPTLTSTSTALIIPEISINILVDDFIPQPYQGDSIYFYNRIGGDRGALNNSNVSWGNGYVGVTLTKRNTWGGIWMSLNHPIREGQSIKFSAIFPPQILLPYQARITGVIISVADATPSKIFRVELKDSNNNLQWASEMTLNGDQQTMNVDLPPLQDISQLVLVLDQGAAGDFMVIDNISLIATIPVNDTETNAFVWSYGMLLNNWNPSTGLVRDKATDASGEFDAIQATGSLAAATALAAQVGVIDRTDAVAIVSKISDTLLNKLPRKHGLWPHWVTTSPDGRIEIVPVTEWSSVDTVIAAIGLLDAQQSLGLETSATEQILREIEWNTLVTEKGISHGYSYDDKLIPYAWDVFGGESWLVELAYASATGNLVPVAYPSTQTANGSGFIDELAWLYIMPPTKLDYWGTNWASYRVAAAEKQISYYASNDPSSCFAQSGLFGLSAAEAAVPARVTKEDIYQAFGVGGQFASVNDGTALLGSPVIAPHYSAMIASLFPQTAIRMWNWLITSGHFLPLNNVESLTFPSGSICDSTHAEWNQLKGSWNLALQTLGWGRYLAERDGYIPAVWLATKANPFLNKGYLLLAPNESSNASQSNGSLSAILKNSNIPCEDESDYKMTLSGIYRYKITDAYGDVKYYSVEQTSESQEIAYYSALGWPPGDAFLPQWISSTTKTGMENITTRIGTFQAFQIDTIQEYRIQTMDHSDPSGTVTRSEWYVCGVGLIHAMLNNSGMYQTRTFERQSELELISFTPLP